MAPNLEQKSSVSAEQEELAKALKSADRVHSAKNILKNFESRVPFKTILALLMFAIITNLASAEEIHDTSNTFPDSSLVLDDDESETAGDYSDLESNPSSEIIPPFDGDLATFTFEDGDFDKIDSVISDILQNVDAELLEDKHISFDLTWNGVELLNEDGSVFEIPAVSGADGSEPDERAQAALLQMVENLPEGSSVSVSFTIDSLSAGDTGELHTVTLSYAVTIDTQISDGADSTEPTVRRTDIKFLDDENQIHTIEGTIVPNGVETNIYLTTASEIQTALAEKGIDLNASGIDDGDTVFVETMTRGNGTASEEIIIRVIKLKGENPIVIEPTSALITIPDTVNIRQERTPNSAKQINTSPFQAATFSDFPNGTDLTDFVLNANGQITVYDGTYNWIALRNPNPSTDEPNVFWAAFADSATVAPAPGTPMPVLSVDGTVVASSQPETAEPFPSPVPVAPEPATAETPPPGGAEGGAQPEVIITPDSMNFPNQEWSTEFTPASARVLVNGEVVLQTYPERNVNFNINSIIRGKDGLPIPLGMIGTIIDGIPSTEITNILDQSAIDRINFTNTYGDLYAVSAQILTIYPSTIGEMAIIGFPDQRGQWKISAINISPIGRIVPVIDGQLVNNAIGSGTAIPFNNANSGFDQRTNSDGLTLSSGDNAIIFLFDQNKNNTSSPSSVSAFINAFPSYNPSSALGDLFISPRAGAYFLVNQSQ